MYHLSKTNNLCMHKYFDNRHSISAWRKLIKTFEFIAGILREFEAFHFMNSKLFVPNEVDLEEQKL